VDSPDHILRYLPDRCSLPVSICPLTQHGSQVTNVLSKGFMLAFPGLPSMMSKRPNSSCLTSSFWTQPPTPWLSPNQPPSTIRACSPHRSIRLLRRTTSSGTRQESTAQQHWLDCRCLRSMPSTLNQTRHLNHNDILSSAMTRLMPMSLPPCSRSM